MQTYFHNETGHDQIREELLHFEDLLYESMDEIWTSRAPLELQDGSHLLDPVKVMNTFAYLKDFFDKTDKALHEEACLIIIKIPTFLYLLANVLMKQIEGIIPFMHTIKIVSV